MIAPRDAPVRKVVGSQHLAVESARHESSGAERIAFLEQAIETLTRRLPHAGDEELGELVVERRAMREELRALRDADSGVVHLDAARSRREMRGR